MEYKQTIAKVKDALNGNRFLYDNKDVKKATFVGMVTIRNGEVISNAMHHERAAVAFCALSQKGKNGYPPMSRRVESHEVTTLEGIKAFWFEYF